MPRKRTRRLTLVLLGAAGLMASGCGNDTPPPHPAAKLDEASRRRLVAAGTSAEVSEAYLHATSLIASNPGTGLAAPLDIAKLAYLTDKAAETYDVTSNNAQLPPRGPGGSDYHPRSHYYYHRGPGIGWFLFGYMMGRSSGTPYVPPRSYSSSPRPFVPSGGGSAGGFSRSSGSPGAGRSSTGGSVSRGGFGGSGGAHASGGS